MTEKTRVFERTNGPSQLHCNGPSFYTVYPVSVRVRRGYACGGSKANIRADSGFARPRPREKSHARTRHPPRAVTCARARARGHRFMPISAPAGSGARGYAGFFCPLPSLVISVRIVASHALTREKNLMPAPAPTTRHGQQPMPMPPIHGQGSPASMTMCPPVGQQGWRLWGV